MKRLLPIIFLGLFSNAGFGQIQADPATSQSDVQNPSNNNSIPANSLMAGQVINFVLPVYNNSFVNGIPTTSMKVSISLGTNMTVDPAFNIANIGPFAGPGMTNSYFTWTQQVLAGGVIKLTGILNQALPSNFPASFTLLDQAVVRLKAGSAGSSSFQSNVIVNNPALLSDTDPTNNQSSLNYTVSGVLPVTYTGFTATQVACDIHADWTLGNELNVSRYEVESGKDGVSFVKVAEVAARGASAYSATFALTDQVSAPSIFVRIKAVDRDGLYHYSDVKTVTGSCEQKQPWKLYVYPNPVSYRSDINIVAKEGNFNGRYKLTLVDNAGKTYKVSEVTLGNVKTFNYQFGKAIAAGKYVVRIANVDGSQATSLEFEKL